MVDTNSDPREVDYVIPANDDASKSIEKILSLVTAAVIDGLSNRNAEGDAAPEMDAEVAEEEVTVAEVVAEAAAEVVAEAAVEAAVESAPETTEEATTTEE
jgi:small subunit ribosomal protein S2